MITPTPISTDTMMMVTYDSEMAMASYSVGSTRLSTCGEGSKSEGVLW